jgi:hypothetical protein
MVPRFQTTSLTYWIEKLPDGPGAATRKIWTAIRFNLRTAASWDYVIVTQLWCPLSADTLFQYLNVSDIVQGA